MLDEAIDVFRRQATLATVRAEQAESSLAAAELRERALGARLGDQDQEITRLRAVVASQAAELGSLREQLRELQQASRMLSVTDLASALTSAIGAGSAALPSAYTVQAASAEIRALLQAGEHAISLTPPAAGTVDPAVLSTVSFSVRPTVPSLADQAFMNSRNGVLAALQELQSALDRDWPQPAQRAAQAASAAVAAVLAAPGVPAELGRRAADVAAALSELGRFATAIADPARRLAATAAITAPDLDRLALAVRDVAAVVRSAA